MIDIPHEYIEERRQMQKNGKSRRVEGKGRTSGLISWPRARPHTRHFGACRDDTPQRDATATQIMFI